MYRYCISHVKPTISVVNMVTGQWRLATGQWPGRYQYYVEHAWISTDYLSHINPLSPKYVIFPALISTTNAKLETFAIV